MTVELSRSPPALVILAAQAGEDGAAATPSRPSSFSKEM
jgi:hypothetical protein